jgi:catabolite regulation protein CreA
MKKILLVLTLVLGTLVSNAQTDTTGLANKVIDLFKKEVVNVSFKDPYSFQLLSIKYVPVTTSQYLESEIQKDSLLIKAYNDLPKSTKIWLPKSFKEEQEKKQEEMLKNIKVNKELLLKMNDDERNKTAIYLITIECRGANSYGNLIYNKYYGKYHVISSWAEGGWAEWLK